MTVARENVHECLTARRALITNGSPSQGGMACVQGFPER